MKKILFTSILFYLITNLHGQGNSGNAFTTGEWLQYRVHYGIFNASYATMELKEAVLMVDPYSMS